MADDDLVIDWRFADDDLWDLMEDLEADLAAGRPVDLRYHAALKAEIEARARDLEPMPEALPPSSGAVKVSEA